MARNLHLLPSLRPPLQNPNPNPRSTHPLLLRAESLRRRRRSSSSSSFSTTLSLGRSKRSSRYAILGAGFAGLSVAWHLLKNSPKESQIRVDIFDENGIGGGASGISGGLLHPYSPKAKLLWKGAECWKECLQLLSVAERVNEATGSDQIIQDSTSKFDGTIVCRRGILRPATSEKNVDILMENTQSSLHCCNLEALDKEAAQSLVPGLCVPFDFAVYMPHAMNIHPKRYLQALFLACGNLADESSVSNNCEERELNLFRESIKSLRQLADEYDAVIICLGAKVDMLPELAGKLPLRTCRGVVAELRLPTNTRGEYGDQSPSILSDAWLAFQGPRSVSLGSTWDWKSKDYTSNVPEEEAHRAMEELLPKAAAVYPEIRRWAFAGARAGLRAMPPVTPHGSLPLLGSLNYMIGAAGECLYWLVGGLGSRGLLYHGVVGKLTAQAVVSCDESVIPSEFTSCLDDKLLSIYLVAELTSPELLFARSSSEKQVNAFPTISSFTCQWLLILQFPITQNPSFVRRQCLRLALYLIVLSVLMRIQWGMGRFCLIFFASFFLILNVLWDGIVVGIWSSSATAEGNPS